MKTKSRLQSVAPVAVFLLSGCVATSTAQPSALPRITAGAPTASAAASKSARPIPPGRLAFGTFNPALDDFVVYTSAPDGSDLTQLLPGPHEAPAWSPDWTEIAVASIGAGGSPGYPVGNVFETILSPDGTVKRHLTLADPTLRLGCGDWSPDGALLLCEGWDETRAGREGLYVVSSKDGSGVRRITTPGGGIHDLAGTFSPDGKQILFVRATDEAKESGELRIVDADGRHARKIRDEAVGYAASFSPDGASILTSTVSGPFLLLDVANLSATPVRIESGLAQFGPAWSPDGTRLVFSAVPQGMRAAELYTMNLDATDLWRVTMTAQRDEFANWGLPAP